MGRFTGKTALVTGASRGIGRGIALRLATEGALVAVHYSHSEAAALQTIERIRTCGGQAFGVQAQLGVPGDAAELWAGFDAGLHARSAPPGLDVLVNNAAIGGSERIEDLTPEQFDQLFAVNVKAPFFIVQQGLSRIRDGGRIINISSGVTRIAYPETIAYSMTKGALNTFNLTLAKDLGARGITVNAVAPGITEAGTNAQLREDPQALARAAGYSAFNRIGYPEDIADVVAFVASADARWITGQILDATGGAQL